MTIPFLGWTFTRPSLRTLALFIGGIAAVAGVVLLFALFGGKFNSPAAPTINMTKAPAITTGTPGGGGQSNMPGYVVDPTTCEITDDVTGEVIGMAADCTPTDAFPSRVPASPDENLNIVDMPGECGVIHDYPLTDLPEVATSGNYIVVENYDLDVAGDPEVESVLWHGRYVVVGNLDGYVWEYSVECSLDEVMAFVQTQIDNRLKDGMNNAGLASQETTDARFSLIDNQAPFWGHFDPDRKNPDAPTCKVMKEYPLAGHNRLSTEGSFIHVEHYVGGEPERESILNGNSSWRVNGGAKGFVWEYNKACSWGQVRAEVRQHTQRRLADHANNAGWIAWDAPALNNRFEQVR
ncbi:MAG: hypothetical protein E6Q53_02510 [Candidatus Moraniibacteriota bacterium]|nr:MAG: hypothetical protein E6Q53_02510 [Candidatus Moranbacteria bacterium]